MIRNKMTVSDVVATVENFIKHYSDFEKRMEDKYELEQVLPKISNHAAVAVLQKEINTIIYEQEKLVADHQLIVQQLVEYVFWNDYRKNQMVVEDHFGVQEFKNDEGNYNDFFFFRFSGQLGKPLQDIMTLGNLYEFWGIGKTCPDPQRLSNTMSYQEFVDVVNNFYIGEGEPLN